MPQMKKKLGQLPRKRTKENGGKSFIRYRVKKMIIRMLKELSVNNISIKKDIEIIKKEPGRKEK